MHVWSNYQISKLIIKLLFINFFEINPKQLSSKTFLQFVEMWTTYAVDVESVVPTKANKKYEITLFAALPKTILMN